MDVGLSGQDLRDQQSAPNHTYMLVYYISMHYCSLVFLLILKSFFTLTTTRAVTRVLPITPSYSTGTFLTIIISPTTLHEPHSNTDTSHYNHIQSLHVPSSTINSSTFTSLSKSPTHPKHKPSLLHTFSRSLASHIHLCQQPHKRSTLLSTTQPLLSKPRPLNQQNSKLPYRQLKMVKWENDKNVYILGAALGALNASITNEIAESVTAGWRKFCVSLFLAFRLPCSFSLLFLFSLPVMTWLLSHSLILACLYLYRSNSSLTATSDSNNHPRRNTNPPRRQRPDQKTLFHWLCHNHHCQKKATGIKKIQSQRSKRQGQERQEESSR